MNSFWTVVGFTLKNKFRGKAFLITTLIIALIITIGINLPYIFSQFNSGDKVTSIGYVQSAQSEGSATGDQLKAYFEAQEKPGVKLVSYEDKGSEAENEKQLKQAITDKDIKGYLAFGEMTDSGFPEMTYKSEKMLAFELTSSIQNGLQVIRQGTVLKDAGLSSEQLALLNAPIEIASVQISATEGAGNLGEGKTPEEQAVNMGLVYFIVILLFMAIMITGQMIASEITAEKSSRVMELLITSVSPLKQMFGKIVGMFLVGLIQITVYVLVIIINIKLPHNNEMLVKFNIDLSQIDPMLLMYSVLFYLTGYFLFATLFAAVGSIVSRTEDLGQAVLPITMLSLAGFYIAIFSISSPDSMLVKISSFIPFFSPFVMLLRLGLTDPPMWQVLGSIGLLLVTIYASVWVSAKIYRTGVLMYGKRPTFKELRKAMKAYKI
ncbi:ABC-2 type transport system permease protein [Paenibacillus endophyticus]|uniref:ABC-2 type transport system permease protein n=1 Tax=Paenibacillus endophyticus TaxID=1294268 RepID=A0A7W5CCF1_9BACL|nr:ABC transporter permease [Paenibacillus endophyticus]MBB3155120.1 ABC-2 type transport system permease protein [Paenibacillus endophyticus]